MFQRRILHENRKKCPKVDTGISALGLKINTCLGINKFEHIILSPIDVLVNLKKTYQFTNSKKKKGT